MLSQHAGHVYTKYIKIVDMNEWSLCLFVFKVPCTMQQGVCLLLFFASVVVVVLPTFRWIPCSTDNLSTHIYRHTSTRSTSYRICCRVSGTLLLGAVCWRCGTFSKQFQICKTAKGGSSGGEGNALNTNKALCTHSKRMSLTYKYMYTGTI